MSFAMIDSGATANFINESFVFSENFVKDLLPFPQTLKVVDGRPISSGQVTHQVSSSMLIDDVHLENVSFNVATLGHFPIILGLPWLCLHSPHIKWEKNKISFESDFYKTNCLLQTSSIESVPESLLITPVSVPQSEVINSGNAQTNLHLIPSLQELVANERELFLFLHPLILFAPPGQVLPCCRILLDLNCLWHCCGLG
jgi:hypothetical protein